MAALQFWFEFASTYSYPAAWRIGSLTAASGVAVEWRPFLLGPIFHAQGWDDSPFNIYPAKGRYMWRDLERLCALHGIAWRRPSRFPRNGLLAARVACSIAEEPCCGEFTRRVYHANFAEDREISDPAVIGSILEAVGEPAGQILERAQSAQNKERLRRHTEEAARAGIFGAPSFVTGGELFWGNERLEQAIKAAQTQAAPSTNGNIHGASDGTDPRELALVAPELFVPDVDAAVHFYQTLGFDLVRCERAAGRATFAIVALGAAIVMLADQQHYGPMGGRDLDGPRGTGIDVRFVVADVDAMYSRCVAAGASVALDIGDRYYGLRDFIVRDVNGYRLRFASPLAGESA